ncbi:MAG: hypothetical protein JSV81_01985, partial [Anaerolineales bacterium]
ETHHNTYQFAEQTPSLDEICGEAAQHLDFYAAAYYTSCADAFRPGGHSVELQGKQALILEKWKDPARLKREWAEVEEACRLYHRPGSFVTFPGYEWQGDGSWGDHNVYYREEGLPVFRVQTIEDLYDRLRVHNAIAVPHHTGYYVGRRAPTWSLCDERISPFMELFSVHGSSESDEEWIGLRQNSHLGPGTAGGTYQNALDAGLHLGAMCSTDNWGIMPGHYGQGLMACLASELTREGLWEAFLARRVYGVTGDRIQLEFTVNGALMGEITGASRQQEIRVGVRGSDALDRVEVLRNGRVIASHCHQGTWQPARPGSRTRFKLRLEIGWGPRPNELDVPDRPWQAELSLSEGRFLNYEPCWVSPGQGIPRLDGDQASFTMLSSTQTAIKPSQNANVFEFEAPPEAELLIRLNGLEARATVHSLALGSRVMWFREECVRMLAEHCGLEPETHPREDPYYNMAYKAKLHRIIPEAGFQTEFVIEDDEPVTKETHYRVRVEQRNGQRAWSSPVWISQRRHHANDSMGHHRLRKRDRSQKRPRLPTSE